MNGKPGWDYRLPKFTHKSKSDGKKQKQDEITAEEEIGIDKAAFGVREMVPPSGQDGLEDCKLKEC